jgi:hydrogenase expression/formation protein HypE
LGKLAAEELNKLLGCIKKNPKVIIPPAPGYDSGVHIIDENSYLVVSTDPCIGVPEKWFGWLLIHYAASDVALFGAKPEFCTITLLGPLKTEAKVFAGIMKQVCSAAEELDMTVIAGHTGTYAELSAIIGSCTAYGRVSKEKLITPAGAQVGDDLICTKELGLETAVNFALKHTSLAERLLTVFRTHELLKLVNMQSCVREASILAKVDGVNAMHDIAEGGLVSALNEMAENSNLGFEVEWKNLPILQDMLVLKKHFNLSRHEMLSTSSTGTVLAAVNPKKRDMALEKLQDDGIKACRIGQFTESKKRTLKVGKEETTFPKTARDPYGKIMSEY